MIELLAPAGNYKGFLGAIHAGADAVYLAGNQYGARAYADNFSEDEILRAITYAHLLGRKVYLTVNTLLKDEEIEHLYEYLVPFYCEGLDGVIVQDIGVFQWIKRNFPDLELHCSTQMAITGVYGAKRLKEMGASRIVVARELNLLEVEHIRTEVDIEIEMFVHGAMCYAYSGNCLFSSMLGGRSGNRGKCAQPCRLPYQLEHESKSQEYLLSLKDMCLLPHLSSLLKAGIHSLKIEGRMKRPEYTAGVTAMYRKYIDCFQKEPKKDLVITEKDLRYLSQLYVRSGLSNGYYNRHNGTEMVTLQEPSYGSASEKLLEEIQEKYLTKEWKVTVAMQVALQVGMPILVKLTHDTYGSVQIKGEVVKEANNRPLREEDVRKQMQKMGDTHFELAAVSIQINGNCFLPIKSINEARRQGVLAMEQLILSKGQQEKRDPKILSECTVTPTKILGNQSREYERGCIGARHENGNQTLHISVMTLEQLEEITSFKKIGRIYLESDIFLQSKQVNKYQKLLCRTKEVEVFLKMPYILRLRSYSELERLEHIVLEDTVQGVLVRNMETLQWLQEIGYKKEIVLDSNMYCFNTEAIHYYKEQGIHMIIPYELNQSEIRKLPFSGESYYCYGKIPMMITANCMHQTKKCCTSRGNEFVNLIDRYQKKLPVYLNCNYCYNVIYNALPLSLHQSITTFVSKYNMQGILNVTNESAVEVRELIDYFAEAFVEEKRSADSIGIEYTKGHLKRGVE